MAYITRVTRLLTVSITLILFGCVEVPLIHPQQQHQPIPTSMIPALVDIPSNSYIMGDAVASGDSDERPSHSVHIDAFEMTKYEISIAQFNLFLSSNGHNQAATSSVNDSLPITNVTWSEANDYAVWLSAQTGDTWRLPSESEWEYAARSGSLALFANGNRPEQLCQIANIADQSTVAAGLNWSDVVSCDDGFSNKTAPVGSFRPNAYGLYDMHGNVWEWVLDCWHASYDGAPDDGSAWMSGNCSKHVIRGGSFKTGQHSARLSNREALGSQERSDQVGFRLVRVR